MPPRPRALADVADTSTAGAAATGATPGPGVGDGIGGAAGDGVAAAGRGGVNVTLGDVPGAVLPGIGEGAWIGVVPASDSYVAALDAVLAAWDGSDGDNARASNGAARLAQ